MVATQEANVATNLVVRNADKDVALAQKQRAAAHGRRAEAEHREILRSVLKRSKRRSVADVLLSMPNVGEGADFNCRNSQGVAEQMSKRHSGALQYLSPWPCYLLGKSRNLTAGNAEPEKSGHWTPASAGVTACLAFPWMTVAEVPSFGFLQCIPGQGNVMLLEPSWSQ